MRLDAVDPTKYNVGVGNKPPPGSSTSPTAPASGFKQYSTADELFIVGGYTINGALSGTDDMHSLWINPSSSSFGDGVAPAATVSTHRRRPPVAGIGSFLFRTANTNTPVRRPLRRDLRVDRTWAQVTPASGSTHTNTASNWSNSGNWDAGGVPNAASAFAYFNGAGGTLSVDSNHTVGTMTFRSGNATVDNRRRRHAHPQRRGQHRRDHQRPGHQQRHHRHCRRRLSHDFRPRFARRRSRRPRRRRARP